MSATTVAMPRLTAHSARRQTLARTARLAKPARHRPDAVLWSLLLMHVTYVWRLPSIVSVLKPVHLAVVSGVLGLGLFLLDRSPRRRLIDVPMAPVRLTVVLLVLMILSVPGGIYPSNSAMYLVQNVMPTLLLMIMLAASMRSVADVEWFMFVNLVAAVGYCLFVVWVFRVGASGRLEELIYYDANDLGLLIVATLPFAGYFMGRGHRWPRRALATFSLPLFLLLLVRSGSRGAFIGLLVITVYLALCYRGVGRVARLSAVSFIAFAFVILGGATYFSKIETMLNPTKDYNWRGKSPTGRIEIWKRGLGYVTDHPVVGIGVNNFQRAEGKLSAIGQELASRGRGFKWSVAHNSYLETAAEAGVGALACFVGLFCVTLYLLRRVTRAMGQLPYLSRELVLAQAFIAALMGYLVCAFFLSAEYFVYPYVLMGLAIGLSKSALPRPQPTA